MVEWRPLIVGIVFTLAVYIILSIAQQGGINGVIAFILGGVLVGFIIKPKTVNKTKIKDLLIYGLILGIITGLISILILIIQMITVGLSDLLTTSIIIPVLEVIFAYIIASLAGVIIGNFAREEYIKSL